VAMIDGEFTVKYLRKDKQGMYLEPANDAFPIIRPETALEIYGQMVGLFRKTH
jgi:repressor LexA